MHVAAIKGDQDGIKKLLEQGMSPNVADFAGNSFANCLIMSPTGEVVKKR